MLSPLSLLPPSLLLSVLTPLAALHTSSSFTSLTVCFLLCQMPLLLSSCSCPLSSVHFCFLGCTLTPSLAFYLSLACFHSFVCVSSFSCTPLPSVTVLLLPSFLALLYKAHHFPLLCLYFLSYSYCQFPVLLASPSLMMPLFIFYYLFLIFLLLSFSSSSFPFLSHDFLFYFIFPTLFPLSCSLTLPPCSFPPCMLNVTHLHFSPSTCCHSWLCFLCVCHSVALLSLSTCYLPLSLHSSPP